MEIHKVPWLVGGKDLFVGVIKQNLGIKQAFFHSSSRRVLLAFMFNSLISD